MLKSDSAMVFIPELELELRHGTLGGVYTTVEGLLMKIRNSLWNSNPFAIGDSTTKHHSEKNELAEVSVLLLISAYRLSELICFCLRENNDFLILWINWLLIPKVLSLI